MSPRTLETAVMPSAKPGEVLTKSFSRNREAVIFLHVPKTAGTTLNRLIEWEYKLPEMYSVDPVLFAWSAAHLRNLPESRLRRTRMFKGHMLFGLHEVLPQSSTYITVLRDPIERVLSAFFFMRTYKLHPLYWKFRREKWTLEEFVRRSTRDNVQCKIIAGADYHSPCTRRSWRKLSITSIATLVSSVYRSGSKKVWR